MKHTNPFSPDASPKPIYFFNREKEIKLILKRVNKKVNIAVISDDGIGKTTVVSQALNQVVKEGNIETIIIDLLCLSTFKVFLINYINALKKLLETKVAEEFDVGFFDNLENYGELDLVKKLNLIFGVICQRKDGILFIFENYHISIQYGLEKFENSILNPIIHTDHISFILVGNKNLFSLHKTEELHLEKIKSDEYEKFVLRLLKKKKISVTKKAIFKIFDWSGGDLTAVNALCSVIWNMEMKKVKTKDVNEAIEKVMLGVNNEFSIIRNLLSPYQWKLLIAIASQDGKYQITSSSFISKYELNAPSSVKTALDALVEKELVFKELKIYKLVNRLFKNWIIFKLRIY